jgi:hypothetical protein
VIAHIVTVVVLVFRAVCMQMNASHRYAFAFARSMDTMRNSSPLSNVTSKLSHVAQARIGMSRVVTARHSRHSTVAGICSITNSHPLRSVDSVSTSHPNSKASGTTWRRCPILTVTWRTGRPSAYFMVVPRMASQRESSCTECLSCAEHIHDLVVHALRDRLRGRTPRRKDGAYNGQVSKPPAPLAHDSGDTTTVEGVLDIVRKQGGRVTSSRRLLLRALFDSKGHHTAEDLAAEVQKQAPDIHLSTIYRNLDE